MRALRHGVRPGRCWGDCTSCSNRRCTCRYRWLPGYHTCTYTLSGTGCLAAIHGCRGVRHPVRHGPTEWLGGRSQRYAIHSRRRLAELALPSACHALPWHQQRQAWAATFIASPCVRVNLVVPTAPTASDVPALTRPMCTLPADKPPAGKNRLLLYRRRGCLRPLPTAATSIADASVR